MSDPVPPPTGAHRASASSGARRRAVIGVAAVLALAFLGSGAVVLAWQSRDVGTGLTAAVLAASGTTSSEPSVSRPSGTGPSGTAPSVSAPSRPVPSGMLSPSGHPSSSAISSHPSNSNVPSSTSAISSNSRPGTSAVRTAPPATRAAVVVLNSTFRTGLAARTAAALRSQGWAVLAVGNRKPAQGVTTVYYPDGLSAVADVLAASLSNRTGLAISARPALHQMSGSALTVVIAADWPSSG